MDSPPPSLLPLEAVEARPDPLQEAGRAGCEPGPCRPDGGFAAQCMASKLQSGVEHCVAQSLLPLAWTSIGRLVIAG